MTVIKKLKSKFENSVTYNVNKLKSILDDAFKDMLKANADSPYEAKDLDKNTQLDKFKKDVFNILNKYSFKNIKSIKIKEYDDYDHAIQSGKVLTELLDKDGEVLYGDEGYGYQLIRSENTFLLIGGMNFTLGLEFIIND